MLLGFGLPGIGEMIIVPLPPLIIGGLLLFFAIKRIRSSSAQTGTALKPFDYAKKLGCLGYIGAGLLLTGFLLAVSCFLGILLSLF